MFVGISTANTACIQGEHDPCAADETCPNIQCFVCTSTNLLS